MDNGNILKSISELQIEMNNIIDSITEIKQKLNASELDIKRCLKSNVPIPPGIGCKFAFDSNGLILKSIPLSSSDIPSIDIDSIKGLRDLINDKISRTELEKIQTESSRFHRSDKIFNTGCKANIDENGFVISFSDLSKEDLPKLNISDIINLDDRLKLIEDTIESNHENIDPFSINPNTGCKITYDSKGRIIKSENLSMDDIPREIISRINELSSNTIDVVHKKSIDEINEKISKLLRSNTPITPGTYSKITFDSNGLVTKGEKLSKEDLPKLNISDITGLDHEINNKANQSDITALYNSIESIFAFINKVGDINAIKLSLDNKAENSSLSSLELTVRSLQEDVNNVITNIPYDSINKCISNLEKEISSLTGRISVIEKKLDIPNM